MNKTKLMASFNCKDHLEAEVRYPGTKGVERPISAHFSHVEPRKIFLEDVSFDQQIEQVPAAHIFEDLMIFGTGN